MKFFSRRALAVAITLGVSAGHAVAQIRTIDAAVARGDASGSFNLRYEAVDEDNALKNADALTLRSALKYTTAPLNGFTGVIEFEDVRIVGVGDFSAPLSGHNPGKYSTIADAETTELNQSYLQYVSGGFTSRLGRQDIRYDNQRFVGAVPWRQDYQSFDAFSLQYKKDAAQTYTLDYNYLTQRERIFAQDADIDSKDHLLHGVINTPVGALTGYAYLLEEDIALDNSLDTYGVRLTGTRNVGGFDATYLAEYATQESERGLAEFDADYYIVEGGLTVKGVAVKLGLESLGSDNGRYGFATPLATLHAFEGWADQFLATPTQGIEDAYLNIALPLVGGTFTFVYHDFSAERSTATVDDLGDEFNLQWVRPIKNNYQYGIKYADYSQGDLLAKADKQILWTWLQMTF
ncbi:MAG: alginate export family protein [Pseudomonadota bacterium]